VKVAGLLEVRDPATEAVIERLPPATAADADAAVRRAAAAPMACFGNAGQDCLRPLARPGRAFGH
jgi:hypothetical protein